jgi:hypothetical protein
MKIEFDPDDIRRGLAVAKLVKPLTNDFILKVMGGKLVIYSYDKRRCARAEIRPQTSIDAGYESDEHFLPADRQAFLDSELVALTLSITDKGMLIKTEGGKQSRQATIKKKAELSRRPPIPPRHTFDAAEQFPAKHLEELLRQVSCSALVRETKTEEDMRVNQVHFYPDEACAVANARFYATMASLPGMKIDLSVVSADLPLMKSFCSKLSEGSVQIGQDSKHLFLSDPSTGSYLIFSRVASKKPALSMLPEEGHEIVVAIDRDQLAKCLNWSAMAIEGTQRLTLMAIAEDTNGEGTMEFLNGKQEISKMPVQFKAGKRFSADFPVKYLAGIVRYLGEGNACLKYAHPQSPTILEITEESPEGTSKARHFIQAMKERT